ncbi:MULTISPECIES: hypothetical protein [Streptosporangiaceae]|uniref:hypothetical protein n=1 Tax=Streptosporangiaceae TaxID=2004 RepID=UPI0033E87343
MTNTLAIRYTFIAADGVAEVRTHEMRDADHAADQLAAARRLQERQGDYRDAQIISAHASLLDGILATTRGCEKLFAALAALAA